MNESEPPSETDSTERTGVHSTLRRRFLGASGVVGAALLAGCASDATSSNGPGEPATGTFRLLISDLPADIGDFDSLDVSFDAARVFKGDDEAEDADEGRDADEGEDADDADDEQTESADDGTDPDADDGSEGADDDGDDGDDDGDDDGENRAWFELDLDGATVDLTQVVGDRAMGVFEGELEAGRYTKIELYVDGVVGIVDGERADVKVPSEKLQIVKPFEVDPEEPVEFVFDINVVRKGQGGYNLLPVIAKSGVNGKDVEVEEIGRADDGDAGDDGDADDGDAGDDGDADDDGDESTDPDSAGGGPPDDG